MHTNNKKSQMFQMHKEKLGLLCNLKTWFINMNWNKKITCYENKVSIMNN